MKRAKDQGAQLSVRWISGFRVVTRPVNESHFTIFCPRLAQQRPSDWITACGRGYVTETYIMHCRVGLYDGVWSSVPVTASTITEVLLGMECVYTAGLVWNTPPKSVPTKNS